MEKILKNISTLVVEVESMLTTIRSYKDINKVFRAFFEKVEKLLLKETKNDLMATFGAIYEILENEEGQKDFIHHLSVIIAVQTILKLGEAQDILAKKNALGQVLKTYIASKIQALCVDNSKSVNGMESSLIILSYLSLGFACWRKTRDHAPEMYAGIKYVLIYIQECLSSSESSNSNSNNKTPATELDSFEDLFEKILIKQANNNTASEKSISHSDVQSLLKSMLAYLNHGFKITNMETNFDFLYTPILFQLEDITLLCEKSGVAIAESVLVSLQETSSKIKEWIGDFSHKSDLGILIEKPLIKIKQLDPRIVESGKDLNAHMEKSRMKKKVKNASKKLVKEIRADQAVMDRKKLEDFEQNLKDKDVARKKFVTIMDNQALEIKRMKTTQINFARNKKKKTRMAGNKTN